MKRAEFWELVEQSRQAAGSDTEAQVSFLSKALLAKGKKPIIAFENQLNECVSELSNFEVLAAHFIIQSYTSDDTFEDFRAWLCMQGRERFEAACANVSSIADWLKREDVESIDGSDFVTVALKAFKKAGGSEDDFYDEVEFADEIDFEIEWPDGKEGFEARWPRLVKTFWNQERIDELHADD